MESSQHDEVPPVSLNGPGKSAPTGTLPPIPVTAWPRTGLPGLH